WQAARGAGPQWRRQDNHHPRDHRTSPWRFRIGQRWRSRHERMARTPTDARGSGLRALRRALLPEPDRRREPRDRIPRQRRRPQLDEETDLGAVPQARGPEEQYGGRALGRRTAGARARARADGQSAGDAARRTHRGPCAGACAVDRDTARNAEIDWRLNPAGRTESPDG